MQVDDVLAKKVLAVVDAGLVSGMGEPTPGEMCVEAAVCYAMGLPHSDQPPYVAYVLRDLKIRLNDSNWSSAVARTKGLRRLALAQLGSMGALDSVKFAQKVSTMTIRTVVPKVLRLAAARYGGRFPTLYTLLNQVAASCASDPSMYNMRAAYGIVSAETVGVLVQDAVEAAAAAAAVFEHYLKHFHSSYSTYNINYVCNLCVVAARRTAAAADLPEADKILAEFGENVVQILIEMQAPGTKFLYLTEES